MTQRSQRGVFVIAEAGVNHNGSLDLGRRLVDAASKAGADAGKFQQWIQPLRQQEELLGAGRHLSIQGNWANLNIYDADIREPVQKIELEIIRRAFPLIIPSVPIRQREKVKAKLFSFEPRRAVTAQRESIKSRFHRRNK